MSRVYVWVWLKSLEGIKPEEATRMRRSGIPVNISGKVLAFIGSDRRDERIPFEHTEFNIITADAFQRSYCESLADSAELIEIVVNRRRHLADKACGEVLEPEAVF
jgi:hypothetical protein